MQSKYISLIDKSLLMGNNLPKEILAIHGMSGSLFRAFLNNLLSISHGCSYLEIGVWKGSCCVSALYRNVGKVKNYWLIDNWSEFGGPKDEFIKNFNNFIGSNPNIFDVDCFGVDPRSLGIKEVDIYFYDGGHSEQDHLNSIVKYLEVMSSEFIFIVDDWNASIVKDSTMKAIESLNLDTLYFREFITNYDEKDTWWNGCGIFVLRKKL